MFNRRCIDLCRSAQVRANLCRNLCIAPKPYVFNVSEDRCTGAQVFSTFFFPGV